jgi:hypothetical protein
MGREGENELVMKSQKSSRAWKRDCKGAFAKKVRDNSVRDNSFDFDLPCQIANVFFTCQTVKSND